MLPRNEDHSAPNARSDESAQTRLLVQNDARVAAVRRSLIHNRRLPGEREIGSYALPDRVMRDWNAGTCAGCVANTTRAWHRNDSSATFADDEG
jgi:hypothetical protein